MGGPAEVFQASQQAAQYNAPGGSITVNQFATPPAGTRRPWLAPPLTDHLIARPDVTDRLLRLVCADADEPVGITGVHGTGGFGKTTLAKWLCHQPETRRRFPGGLLWVTLGEHVAGAELAAKVNDLAEQLSGSRPAFTDPLQAGFRLGEILDAAGGPVLLVVDDAWTDQQLEPFRCGGRGCRRLLTTRTRRLLDPRHSVPLDQMTAAQSAALLTRDVTGAPAAPVARVVAATGGWPVLLALANRALVRSIDYGASAGQALAEIADRLDEDGPATFDVDNAHHRGRAVAATVRAGLDLLSPDRVDRFFELAVFPEDADIPLAALELLWGATAGLHPGRVRGVCESLADLALVQEYRRSAETVRLHDVIRSYLIHAAGDHRLVELNKGLLDAAAGVAPTVDGRPAWWQLPARHDYLIRNLTGHLAGAGRHDELAATVTDPRWILSRLRRHGPAGAEADLTAAHTDLASLLGRKIRQNAHLLAPTAPEHALGAILHSRLGALAATPDPPTPRLTNRWPLPDLPHPALLRTFIGHTDRVAVTVVAPDGTWVATGGGDHTVRVWDPATGACRHTLSGHHSEVTSLAVPAHGGWLATGSADHDVSVWDPATGARLATLTGHTAPVIALATPASGAWLASAGHDRTVRLWDPLTGECRATLTGHTDRLTALAAAPGGEYLATAGQDCSVRLWDPITARCRHVLEGHDNWIASVAVAADGSWLATGSGDSTVRLWDPESGECLRTLRGHNGIVCALAAPADGDWLASASHDNTIRVWDPATGACRRVLAGHTDWVVGLAAVPGGAPRIATAGHDRTVRIWDPLTGTCEGVYVGHTDRVTTVVPAPSGQWLATAADDHTVRTWSNAATGPDLTRAGHTARIVALAAVPSGEWVATASQDHSLRIWDAASGACRRVIVGHSNPVTGLIVSPDGTWVASSSDSHTRVFDPHSGDRRHTLIGHSEPVRAMAVAPDGSWLATGGADGAVRVWDPATGECRHVLTGPHGGVGRLTGPHGGVGRLIVDPLGQWLAAGTVEGRVSIWDPVTGRRLRELDGHENWIGPAMAAPDGTWLATACGDFTVRVWDPRAGVARHKFDWYQGWISALAAAPDGSWLAAACPQGPLRLWDLTTGTRRYDVAGHPWPIVALAAAPHGDWLAAAGRDGTITVWRPDDPDPVAAMRVDATLTTGIALPDGTGITVGSTGGAVYTFDLAGQFPGADRQPETHPSY
ncbi:NB-ARC domain-containing protein [Actinoplanes sp. KI2]|uniref:NB-ARC domain-containing protein n=1 Tax=Actinoplanes sp. KI2 TaxID=2983315 RepID=UPI0021D56F98|nr:NB-ARC domain-containing protein [Actinoplanes sp. KI2]MCU7723815.1 NB-ARC domain-containing protein [Actinoplanes sp. KI2]